MTDTSRGEGTGGCRPSRRDFLKLSALAAAAGAAPKLVRAAQGGLSSSLYGRANSMPGRIIIFHDAAMNGHLTTIARDVVEQAVLHGVRILTEVVDVGAAFEALFPGLHAGSTIAIKVNCIGPTDTRWETVRGVISGLSRMLGGTYDVSQVTIYDQNTLSNHNYRADQFTFNGHYPNIVSSADCYSGYYVYAGHQLSNFILHSDFVINMPVLKSHDRPLQQITLALKNHYGSCCPQSFCDNIPGMLTLNSDPYVKDKTALVLMDGLRGTYNGAPGNPPQSWNIFPEHSPNTLFFSTDPTTNEYWGRDLINAERVTHGWSEKPAPWIEQSSQAPYNIGVSDPGAMTVVRFDPTDVNDGETLAGASFLVPNVPNPFSEQTTLRFRLAAAGPARLTVADASGRMIRDLGARDFPAGYSELDWDGRDALGRRAPAGVYFVNLEAAGIRRSRRMILTR